MVSSHHVQPGHSSSLQPDARLPTGNSQSPLNKLLEHPSATQINQEEKKWLALSLLGDGQAQSGVWWATAPSSQPQKAKKDSRASSPRCEFFPQKIDFTFISHFLAAFAEAHLLPQWGAGSGAGSRPAPGQTRPVGHDCTAPAALWQPFLPAAPSPGGHKTSRAKMHLAKDGFQTRDTKKQ